MPSGSSTSSAARFRSHVALDRVLDVLRLSRVLGRVADDDVEPLLFRSEPVKDLEHITGLKLGRADPD